MTAEKSIRPTLCMVVHAHYPVGEPRVQREARAATAAGYDVHIVSLGGRNEAAQEVIEGARVHRVAIQHRRGFGLLRTTVEYVRFSFAASVAVARLHRRHRFAVVHVHAPPDFLIAAAVVPRLRGAKVILDIHDLSPDMFGARFGDSPAGRVLAALLRAVETLSCHLADRVVTVHEPYRAELGAHGVPLEKITVLMNSPDVDLIDRARLSVPASAVDFEVAYHGTVTSWYGVDLLVRAVGQLVPEFPGLRAVVLGEGDALEDVMSLAAEIGVADRIEFSGRYLPIEQALARVSTASCGVIPNRASRLNRFALSSKLFEYIALGVPVVVTRLETLAAHFGKEEVVFFEPGDADALAAAVKSVAADPISAAARAERARVRAREYSWATSAARYVALLGSLAC